MTLSPVRQSQLAELYDQDFCQWVEHTAQLLREGQFSALDLANLIEEVEDMGKSQKRALLSNLRVLLLHLLKYQYQPQKRSPSWRSSILEHRIRITNALEESPSLKSYLLSNFDRTYGQARKQAAVETELELATFPSTCPFLPETVLDESWIPD